MIIELTEKLIQDAFSKTGIDKKYYPQYEAEAKRCYAALQKADPDDEGSTENDNNVKASIDNTNEYIVFYVSEIEKGHSHAWSNGYAHNSVWGEDDYRIVQYTLESLEDNEKETEFEIYATSLSEDPLFVNRFKFLFAQSDPDLHKKALEKAEEYCRVYHECIEKGKSLVYAHAYAEAVNEDMIEFYCDIYAEAYELAITHGEDDSASDDFGRFCSNAADNSILMLHDFSKKFTKDWQKEFFIRLICNDYEKDYKRPMDNSLLEEIRKELYK